MGPLFPSYPLGLLTCAAIFFSSGSKPVPQIMFPKVAQTQPAHLLALCPFPECSRGPHHVPLCRTHLASFPSIPSSPGVSAAPKVQTAYLVTFVQGSQPSTFIPGLPGPLYDDTLMTFSLHSIGGDWTLEAVPSVTYRKCRVMTPWTWPSTLPSLPAFFSLTRPQGQGPGPSSLGLFLSTPVGRI